MGRPLTDIGQARLRKEVALARLRELQSGQLEAKLLDAAEVRAAWSQVFAALRDRGLGLADRISTRGAGRSVDELRSIVDSEVRSLLEVVAGGQF